MRDGPLDMRMDTSRGLSAAEWIASADEQEIARVIKEYGEERFARRMASAVIRERAIKPITGTVQLAKILAAAHPAWERGRHPATKAFQGIRIFINRELGRFGRFVGPGDRYIKGGWSAGDYQLPFIGGSAGKAVYSRSGAGYQAAQKFAGPRCGSRRSPSKGWQSY